MMRRVWGVGESVRVWGAGVVVCVVAALLMLAPVQRGVEAQATAAQAAEPVDYDAITRIKDEGLNRSQIMDTMSWLTDVHGPRVTGSPQIKKAADWAVQKLTSWGLANAKHEPYTPVTGPFGRGWTNDKFYMQVTAPVPFHVIGNPKVWTPGTNGLVSAQVVLAPIVREEDLAQWKGKLKGKFVMTAVMRAVNPQTEPAVKTFSNAELEREAQPVVPVGEQAQGGRGGFGAAQALTRRIQQFFFDEGVAAWIEFGRGDGGTIFVQSGGGRRPDEPPAPPRVAIAIEHYGRIYRMLQKNVPVTLEAEIKNTFYDKAETFNVIAEIPGTDKADEVVMLGGHFDSWHGGTGATDDAAGCAVMMEAVRILKAAGLRPRRTVRIGMWSGEEQGLLGSRAYVRDHFAEVLEQPKREWRVKPEHAKLVAYYNVDSGTGKIRGAYLQGNEALMPIFGAWMEPFRTMDMTTLSIRNSGGTDHLAFTAAGLVGVDFMQDDFEYETRTHHSNMDTYERIQEANMKQMAVIVASFVYHTANRAQALPRKPMPPPPAPRGGGRD